MINSCPNRPVRTRFVRRTIAARPLAVALACVLSGGPLPAVASSGTASASGSGGAVTFNSAFMLGEGVDLSRYAHGNPVDPGTYRLDVVVNGQILDRRDVVFHASEATPHQAQPCLTTLVLAHAGVKPGYLTEATEAMACVDLPTLIPHARVSYDAQALRLDLSIPQAALEQVTAGTVSPALWDQGVTAALLDYQANAQRTDRGLNAYMGLNTGLNFGAWRLRHRASVQHTEVGTDYRAIESHVQRDLPAWRSQLLIGQGITGGELFDSQSFTGVRLSSDDRMLPDVLRGYAPVVRGNADTEAKVTIRQNGYVIREVSVAPGPFEIDDLYPTAHSGDLEVTVTGVDGREQRFTVSFAAVPQALRAGASRYSASAGRLRRPDGNGEEPAYLQASYARGVNNYLTVLGGTELSDGYRAALVGAAVNTPFGAFGADVTHATSEVAGSQSVGNSLRLNYQRHFTETGTHFGLAAYRYSTAGYLTLSEAVLLRDSDGLEGGDPALSLRTRHRLQLDFSQALGERSSLFVRGGYARYWTQQPVQTDYQIGFQSSWRSASYSLSLMRTRDAQERNDDRMMFSLSLPLGSAARAPRMSASMQQGGRQGHSGQVGVNGQWGERNTLAYNVSASTAGGEGGQAYHAGLQYRAPAANLGVSYGHSNANTTIAANASGALVLHGGGINFSPSLSESFVLIEAPGAEGARVGSGETRVGANGYAIWPNAAPYRWNDVSLDPAGLALEVELLEASKRVVPTAGAAVKVPFATRVDTTVFIRATDRTGGPLAYFGESVRDEAGAVVGLVSQGGVIQVRGHERGRLTVGGDNACVLDYVAPAQADAQGLRWAQAVCQPLLLAQDEDADAASGVSE